MSKISSISKNLLVGCAAAALSACGANDVASPGSGGSITINNPAPAPAPTPTPTPTPTTVTPAGGCPTLAAGANPLVDRGVTPTTPTGVWRICELPQTINQSITLTKVPGLLYSLPGRVNVGCDRGPADNAVPAACTIPSVTLSIEPGAILFGNTGVSWLAVNRGNKINAVGTATQPIIFTSKDNVLGLNGTNQSGQWGGVVLMGRAPITDCAVPAAAPGTVACERQTEGAADPALYGGANSADSSGALAFVQIRYSGYVLGANSELQALTTEGTGTGTRLDHIMSYNSSDDAAEFFGGNVNMKYFIAVGAEDDNLDTDTGVKANFQYVIAVQRPNIGDAIIEADSDNAVDGNTPRQNTRVANFTFIDRSPNPTSDVASILLRGGTDYTLVNGILSSPNNPCLRISRPQTASTTADAAIDEAGAPIFRSVVMQCNGTKYLGANGVTDAVVQTLFGSGANNNNDAFTASLTSVFINGANETAVVATDPKTLNAFFDTTNYIGAVKDANDTWYQGWTCNSETANFGSGNSGLCTSLPTT